MDINFGMVAAVRESFLSINGCQFREFLETLRSESSHEVCCIRNELVSQERKHLGGELD